jgi:hypothetical protein
VAGLAKLGAPVGVHVKEIAFYGNHSSVSISEQLHRTARCSLITGLCVCVMCVSLCWSMIFDHLLHYPAALHCTLLPDNRFVCVCVYVYGCALKCESCPRIVLSSCTTFNRCVYLTAHYVV